MARFPFLPRRPAAPPAAAPAPAAAGSPGSTEDWLADTWLTPLPVPDVREGGESTWEQWHEAARELDQAFAQTLPSEVAPLSSDSGSPEQPAHAAGPLTADALIAAARRHNRVCPQPPQWTRLYRLLQGDRYVDLPPPPVERGTWRQQSNLQKRLRFQEYVEWAERHGKLAHVEWFIDTLAEADWLHMGE